MPIRIEPVGDRYTAEVTPPHGSWRSSQPMESNELARELLRVGCRPLDIAQALREVGIRGYSGFYREVAEGAERQLRAALSGRFSIAPQDPFVEAWLALSLFLGDSPQSMKQIIDGADYIWHAVPDSEQVAWAFVRLTRRGWLMKSGDTYWLTDDARRTIDIVAKQGTVGVLEGVERLHRWVEANPPPGGE